MPRNLVFCADGTANTPEDNTNVHRIYRGLDPDGTKPRIGYDQGVGTRFGNFLRGMMFGGGLARNIREGHEFLSERYRPGDRIYLFGFSRGAYTVRSLASMISLCGLAPDGDSSKPFWKVYKKNRKPGHAERRRELVAEHGGVAAPVEAVCVWDTVGAVGRQTRKSDIRRKLWHRYHRMSVWPEIRRLYHAVSLDERRNQYFPHLLTGQGMGGDDQIIEEVWFPGVHSDVGGGYEEKGLSDNPLDWMVGKVREELGFTDEFLEGVKPDPLAAMHNEESGLLWGLFSKRSRPVARGSRLHGSVLTRIRGPLKRFHQHREPSGNYEPLSLNYARYGSPPEFNLPGNYEVV